MPERTVTKEQLVTALMDAARDASTWTVLYHQAIADQAGLSITDHKALDLLSRFGPLTAGQLAEITGLTTGAVTGVVDRLEKAGYARRVNDPKDRRRVIIEPVAEKADQVMGPLFGHLQERFSPLMGKYGTEDLQLLLAYTQETVRFLQAEIDWLKQQNKKG